MNYRNDIDGLRALAVGGVVLGHIPVFGLRGGPMGVDMFFVISGFLITRIIRDALDAQRFSLIDFYRRRVARILPALLTMIVLVCAVAPLILLPSELRTLGRSAAAAAGFVSNHHFWRGAGYFESGIVRPLLHSWSLGVEKQFYLFYPIVLIALHRWRPGMTAPALVAITLASVALCWWLNSQGSAAAFYLLPARAWELALGGLTAMCRPPRLPRAGAEGLAAASLIVLIVTLVRAPAGLSLPFPAALPACLATASLLLFAQGSRTAALLGVPLLRWLGLRSYSLYLWHWPLIVLFPLAVGHAPSIQEAIAIVAAAIVLAELSWRLVETPARRRLRRSGSPGRVVVAGLGACVSVALLALVYGANAASLRPLPPQVARVDAYTDYANKLPNRLGKHPDNPCQGPAAGFVADRCLTFDPARRNILLFGDSHAAHAWRAIRERFPDARVLLASGAGCRPLEGIPGQPPCRKLVRTVIGEAIESRRVQAVVLAGRWQPGDAVPLAAMVRRIRAAQLPVLVLGPVATYDVPGPSLVARALLRRDPAMVRDHLMDYVPALDRELRAAVIAAGGRYYSMFERECPGGKCLLLTRDGAPFHIDKSHLTLRGAQQLLAQLPRP